jgi:hypothetical protein
MNTDLPVQYSPYGAIYSPYGIGAQRTIPGLENSAAYTEWLGMARKYRDWWGWIDRRKLDAVNPDVQNQPAWLFPLKINVPMAVGARHAAALFGEATGDVQNPFVDVEFTDASGKKTEICEGAHDFVSGILRASNAGTLFHQGAVMSQILGGAIYKVAWRANVSALSKNHIRIEYVQPDFFVPIYDPGNPWDLLEAHVIYDISKEDAMERYGVEVDQRLVLYHEHWTRDTYKVEIGGVTPKANMGGLTFEMSGENPFGFVPFVYIPHFMRMGSFYGMSHVTDLEALALELNSSMADRGDNVKEAAGNEYWMRNSPNGARIRPISERFPAVVDLGSNPMGKDQPEINRFETGTLNEAQSRYTEELWDLIGKMGSVPDVIWGTDKMSSQRSSLTFAYASWSMISHIKRERAQWAVGVATMTQMILQMALAKNLRGVSASMLDLVPNVKFQEIMPRDRMELVNEMAVRKSANIVSTEYAVTQISTGEDIAEHLVQIDADMEKMADLAIKQKKADLAVSEKPNQTLSKDNN